MKKTKNDRRARIKKSIAKKVYGTAERPRLSVFRSNCNTYAQLINDDTASTLASVSSLTKELKEELNGKKPIEVGQRIGLALAKLAKDAKIENVVFDRNGYLYHGRVKAVADGAREGGLKF